MLPLQYPSPKIRFLLYVLDLDRRRPASDGLDRLVLLSDVRERWLVMKIGVALVMIMSSAVNRMTLGRGWVRC